MLPPDFLHYVPQTNKVLFWFFIVVLPFGDFFVCFHFFLLLREKEIFGPLRWALYKTDINIIRICSVLRAFLSSDSPAPSRINGVQNRHGGKPNEDKVVEK